jgi:hypothetical protein
MAQAGIYDTINLKRRGHRAKLILLELGLVILRRAFAGINVAH